MPNNPNFFKYKYIITKKLIYCLSCSIRCLLRLISQLIIKIPQKKKLFFLHIPLFFNDIYLSEGEVSCPHIKKRALLANEGAANIPSVNANFHQCLLLTWHHVIFYLFNFFFITFFSQRI